MLGAPDGRSEGAKDKPSLTCDGTAEGISEGTVDRSNGFMLKASEGVADGAIEKLGGTLGIADGNMEDGVLEGIAEPTFDGPPEGIMISNVVLGMADTTMLGRFDGSLLC